ncbi:MAG: phospho-N-acetylmuramoyl-pentapeptide-transferase [Muribaculaceae bacterium]|nr:phospho-N-acetylmuramoyl-pentapeptide-transferase [Muribaculaceae bacterium]MCI9053939.1 phospho-N-acetylmuramoyl-pentapeptide-transferase [Muribaculaceae bacterium]
MLYYLFDYLQHLDVPGARLMTYLTFRSGVAFVLAMLLAIFVGKRIIERLQLMQVGEIVRNLDLEGQTKKTGTPTMGGVIIILSIIVPCLLMGNLSNVYMLLMLVATLWLGSLGFLDDYKKLSKHNKDGIKGKYKIIGQLGIAVILAGTMYLNPDMVTVQNREVVSETTGMVEEVIYDTEMTKSPETTLPFVKNNNFNYSWLTSWMGGHAAEVGGWVVFLLIVMFLVTATSNGANLNDGLDGMTSGLSAVAGVALAIMAYLGGNVVYSAYLNIMYIPESGELVVYMAAFIGALVGFLWYNAYPAQVFMGDTGSLTLGGIIAVYAILIHKELLLPILCALFYIEDLSVMLQVLYYKKTGGRRIFKMAPLHHHFQKPGNAGIDALIQRPIQAIPEAKIVTRFWIIGIILAVVTFVTLKIR